MFRAASRLRAFSTVTRKPVAVVLSGCGVYDGSEIQEAVSVLVHLAKAGREVKCYAPNKEQHHVVDHTSGKEMAPPRNVLVESARIARGKIEALEALQSSVDKHDAVIFPGGFGAAKNLCSFAVEGAAMKVDEGVEDVLKKFHKAGKPIGLCCISPVLAARVFPGVRVTVGSDAEQGGKWPYAGTAGAIKAMGGEHVKQESMTAAVVDAGNKVVTSPAYMKDAAVDEVFDSVGAMVSEVLKLTPTK